MSGLKTAPSPHRPRSVPDASFSIKTFLHSAGSVINCQERIFLELIRESRTDEETGSRHSCPCGCGKTTLSEAMLYTGGAVRKLGRVDKGDAFLDTYELEKKRGITIFSKQAILEWNGMQVTLLDTPGHVDFSAEMERTLQVLDYAVLVISGTDGVQGHTQTLWRLLARYKIPAFLFVNKMDLAGERKEAILEELTRKLDGNIVDFGNRDGRFYENLAMCGEAALDQFLENGMIHRTM